MATHFKSNTKVLIDTFNNVEGFPEMKILDFIERPELDQYLVEGEYFYTNDVGEYVQIRRFVLTFTPAEVNQLASLLSVPPLSSETDRREALRAAGALHILDLEARWNLSGANWVKQQLEKTYKTLK